jgi:hypothetical protein
MRLLQLRCKSCGAHFETGVPLHREHLEGCKIRCLEVCPACGAAADYRDEDYLDPEESTASPDGLSTGTSPGPGGPSAGA